MISVHLIILNYHSKRDCGRQLSATVTHQQDEEGIGGVGVVGVGVVGVGE